MRFEGKLYYDNSKLEFTDKVKAWTEQYAREMNKIPKACKVHPSMTELTEIDGIAIERTIVINPNYFWIGAEIEDI